MTVPFGAAASAASLLPAKVTFRRPVDGAEIRDAEVLTGCGKLTRATAREALKLALDRARKGEEMFLAEKRAGHLTIVVAGELRDVDLRAWDVESVDGAAMGRGAA